MNCVILTRRHICGSYVFAGPLSRVPCEFDLLLVRLELPNIHLFHVRDRGLALAACVPEVARENGEGTHNSNLEICAGHGMGVHAS